MTIATRLTLLEQRLLPAAPYVPEIRTLLFYCEDTLVEQWDWNPDTRTFDITRYDRPLPEPTPAAAPAADSEAGEEALETWIL